MNGSISETREFGRYERNAMNKLFEAAKAVVAINRSAGHQHDNLRKAVVAEEQRLADEQLPATLEWLTEKRDFPEQHDVENRCVRVFMQSDGIRYVYADFINGLMILYVGKTEIVKNPTRRQVLCLLEAMGVKP